MADGEVSMLLRAVKRNTVAPIHLTVWILSPPPNPTSKAAVTSPREGDDGRRDQNDSSFLQLPRPARRRGGRVTTRQLSQASHHYPIIDTHPSVNPAASRLTMPPTRLIIASLRFPMCLLDLSQTTSVYQSTFNQSSVQIKISMWKSVAQTTFFAFGIRWSGDSSGGIWTYPSRR